MTSDAKMLSDNHFLWIIPPYPLQAKLEFIIMLTFFKRSVLFFAGRQSKTKEILLNNKNDKWHFRSNTISDSKTNWLLLIIGQW